jgi:hypothetical protein
MTILRKASDIKEASTSDLLETYNAMTGKSIKKFASRAAAERQVEMALLSAADAAGHAGVAPNTKPEPKTVSELKSKRSPAPAEKAVPAPRKGAANPFATGTLANGLLNAAEAAKKATKAAPGKRLPLTHIRLVEGATSDRMQSGSERRAVFERIQKIGADLSPIDISKLEKFFEGKLAGAVRGHLSKLLDSERITRVDAEQ